MNHFINIYEFQEYCSNKMKIVILIVVLIYQLIEFIYSYYIFDNKNAYENERYSAENIMITWFSKNHFIEILNEPFY